MFFSDLIRGGQILSHFLTMAKQTIKTILLYSFITTLLIILNRLNKQVKLNDVRTTIGWYRAYYNVNDNKPNKLVRMRNYTIDNKGINYNTNNNYTIDTDNNNYNNHNNNSHNTNSNHNNTTNHPSPTSINLKSIDIIRNITYTNTKNQLISLLITNFTNFFLIFFSFNLLIIFVFTFKGYLVNKDKFLRGVKVVPLKKLNKIIKKYNRQQARIKRKRIIYHYKIANAFYPNNTETLHTIITGASGTGKTVLISDLIKQIRKNGDRAIIYDRMGAFVSKFYNGDEIENKLKELDNKIIRTEQDINIKPYRKQELYNIFNSQKNNILNLESDTILNPLDARCPCWSIFNEVRNSIDFDNIASALIPENAGNIDPFWNSAARILFSSVATKLREVGKTSNKDLIDKLLTINLTEAAELVKGTPAQAIIDENNPKTALSVMAMISTNLRALTTLRDNHNPTEELFSIRKWINTDNQKGFLFISSRADRHETLKPLISTWLDIAINSLLSLDQSNNRKIWLIIDELPSLHYLPSLHTGLAEARQFGGCFVLSMQLMAQLQAIYGRDKAIATSGLCRNRVFLNTPDKETAQWCSDNLGKVEIKETRESVSYGSTDMKDGVNVNQQEVQRNIILPTEIMQLNNLNAYIKFAGDFPITLSKFEYSKFEKKAEKMVEREGDGDSGSWSESGSDNTIITNDTTTSDNTSDNMTTNNNTTENNTTTDNDNFNNKELMMPNIVAPMQRQLISIYMEQKKETATNTQETIKDYENENDYLEDDEENLNEAEQFEEEVEWKPTDEDIKEIENDITENDYLDITDIELEKQLNTKNKNNKKNKKKGEY